MAATNSEKAIHTLILDAGPIIKGEPAVSTMLRQCEQIITTPAVISEIRDLATRTRLQTTLLPFLILRRPLPSSVDLVAAFARKTGDFSVLSATDVELLALAYDLECERNNGDSRLRKTPGQKRTNAPSPPAAINTETLPKHVQVQLRDGQEDLANSRAQTVEADRPDHYLKVSSKNEEPLIAAETSPVELGEGVQIPPHDSPTQSPTEVQVSLDIRKLTVEPLSIESRAFVQDPVAKQPKNAQLSHEGPLVEELLVNQVADDHVLTGEDQDDETFDDSGGEGWITPSNIKRKQLENSQVAGTTDKMPKVMQTVSFDANST
jgi:RNA-binding protein NOB1